MNFNARARRSFSGGIALIITLIMLAVITFMAVTFLVLTSRERGQVSTTTSQTTAGFTADSGLERAKLELLARMMAFNNDQNYDLIVSTNFINAAGFQPGISDPTNVNYDHLTASSGGGPLPIVQFEQNLANLLYNPRPPVFVVTNSSFPNNTDFRYYLDLNRNGHYDANGLVPVISPFPGLPYYDTNGNPIALLNPPNVLSNTFVGDPEWIGILEHSDRPHSPTNKFIGRYAYIVVPAGKTLDVNYIHNQAKTRSLTGNDGYERNQGVGSWEMNLAAFLADLNTNLWNNSIAPYHYQEIINFPNSGTAFEDALAMLNYRYGQNYGNLMRANQLFGQNGAPFLNDGIDEYSDGVIQTGTALNGDNDDITLSWPGADNPNHFFTTQEFFDQQKTSTAFVNRMSTVGTNASSYDQYTFYRMLAQLGTDSLPEQGKMNLNYVNVDANGNIVDGMETNLIRWTALQFFTNAAQRMFAQLNLRDFHGNLITVTNIPLYLPWTNTFVDPATGNLVTGVTNVNYYTPAVHRILQLAANMYDATTNYAGLSGYPYLPSVFRPYFRSIDGAVSIAGYLEVTDAADVHRPYLELANVSKTAQINTTANIFGVPWVIGAKKGFPNFNLCANNTTIQVTRKLLLTKGSPKGSVTNTLQLYSFGLFNSAAIEAWNSYSTAWTNNRSLQLLATNDFSIQITNQFGVNLIPANWQTNYSSGREILNLISWPKFNPTYPTNSMIFPILANYFVLSNATYHAHPPSGFVSLTNLFEPVTPIPQWYVVIKKRVRFALIDTHVNPNRIVDFVNLDDATQVINLTALIAGYAQCSFQQPLHENAFWCTNLIAGLPAAPGENILGIDSQIEASAGSVKVLGWNYPTVDANNAYQIQSFNDFLNNNGSTDTSAQTPYNPTYSTNIPTSWEANDPLVHYTIGDLTDLQSQRRTNLPPASVNHRYQPWGTDNMNNENFLVEKKDPLLGSSDFWDFPANLFPNVGWLGRVHRGTPWQTVYLKANAINLGSWTNWTGDNLHFGTNIFTIDGAYTTPTNDWGLFDLFTTGINGNATRGQLSVNQTNLAAWSAVLSGVPVLTNSVTGTIGWTNIEPAGVYNPFLPLAQQPNKLVQIVQGINNTRANTNLQTGPVFVNQVFNHLGDVLATPQLTKLSPFLNLTNLATVSAGGISDEVMERIPQQIMSLLTVSHSPRFVIYSYGQSLKPADHSIVTSGSAVGLCTNYQVTAESAIRAVVRVEGTFDPQYVSGKVDAFGRTYPPRIVLEQYNPLPPD